MFKISFSFWEQFWPGKYHLNSNLCGGGVVHLNQIFFFSCWDFFCGEMFSFELIRILKTPHNKPEYEEESCQTWKWADRWEVERNMKKCWKKCEKKSKEMWKSVEWNVRKSRKKCENYLKWNVRKYWKTYEKIVRWKV